MYCYRYHFLVLLFNQEDETSLELPFSEEELKEKYEGKLEKELSGPTYEVLSAIMKHILNRKLTGPGAFIGHSGTPAISCSFKAAAGLLYPLERGFIYVHKPPIHIRFEEIASVNFARGGGSTRTFDFEIDLKSGTIHTFSSIEKEEYSKLFDFITSKKLNIKNRGKNDKASYKDDFRGSDEEAAPDAYLERVKAEGQEKDESDDEDESTDEDFNPGEKDESDVAEEFDSNHSSSSEDDEEGGGDKGSDGEKKKKKEKSKAKKTKTISEKPRKKREKKERDENKPKRPTTAFMYWLNQHREKIKEENKGITVTEIAKKGGEMWRELKDKSEWDGKAKKDKERYEKEMAEYKASGGDTAAKKSSGAKKESGGDVKKKKSTSSKNELKVDSNKIKSKEYVDDDSSSDDDKKSSKDKKPKKDSGDDDSEADIEDSDDEKAKKTPEKKGSKAGDDKKKSPDKKAKKDSDDEESEADTEESDDDKSKKKPPVKKRKKESDDEKETKKAKKKGSDSEDVEDEEEVEDTPPSSDADNDSD